jgi:cation diffusion facilitator family transporter
LIGWRGFAILPVENREEGDRGVAFPDEVTIPPIGGAVRTTLLSIAASGVLAAIKIATGWMGNSYALVADGIESLTDILASLAVVIGLCYSVKSPDKEHPYGHGRVETFSGLFVALCLLGAAGVIAWQSIQEIRTPHQSPAWFTLPVLAMVVLVKAVLSRVIGKSGQLHGSQAMRLDSWHHASDAITSTAAFIGISIALWGGPDYAAADDWAALVACGVIVWNGLGLTHQSLNELMDAQADSQLLAVLRGIAQSTEGVRRVEKIRVRKSGLGYLMDIHIEVDPHLTVEAGHEIAGATKGALLRSPNRVLDVTVHVEPYYPQSPPNSPGTE